MGIRMSVKVNTCYHYIGDENKRYRVVAVAKAAGELRRMSDDLIVVYQYDNPPDDYCGELIFTRFLSDFKRRMLEA